MPGYLVSQPGNPSLDPRREMDDINDQSAAPDAPDTPDQSAGLDIFVERVDAETVHVRAVGELDLATSPGLERELDEVIADGSRTSIVLDLRDLSFLDSTGLRCLWTARQHALSTGGTLVIDQPSDPVLRVLRMTRLDKVFHIQRDGDGLGSELPAAQPIAP